MKEELHHHLNKFVSIDKKERVQILFYFELKLLKKKEVLMEANKKCTSNYFVVKGCIHLLFVNEKGT